jgi:anaerobic selenocysteine-containing dehydrogenase
MFADDVRGLADVVLPGTSYLERDGTMVNLEGRVQRLRRTTRPPGRDDLDWIGELGARFDVSLEPPYGLPLAAAALQAPLPERSDAAVPEGAGVAELSKPPVAPNPPVRYRLAPGGFPRAELGFQRAEPVIELSAEDASRRSIKSGDTVTVLADGTSTELRARINPKLVDGAARAAEEHVRGLPDLIEVLP